MALLELTQELSEEAAGSPIPEPKQRRLFRSQSESSDELSELDLSHGKKDAFVLEVCAAAGVGQDGVALMLLCGCAPIVLAIPLCRAGPDPP